MPIINQNSLFYILELLSIFARKSDLNLMSPRGKNLSVLSLSSINSISALAKKFCIGLILRDHGPPLSELYSMFAAVAIDILVFMIEQFELLMLGIVKDEASSSRSTLVPGAAPSIFEEDFDDDVDHTSYAESISTLAYSIETGKLVHASMDTSDMDGDSERSYDDAITLASFEWIDHRCLCGFARFRKSWRKYQYYVISLHTITCFSRAWGGICHCQV